ncbi:9311_t:CDS:1 [Diversispora eburnea]|uniref:9311_t:CDS:1 n=1 Tax=Diversispora eburnea TaxID=1213867 RepID=A0A9N8WLL0_9GLOM|nr:9311_t:CDS:1 [Diversispora eburnea]
MNAQEIIHYMNSISLLEMNAQEIIHYMRGNKVPISGKNVFFIQLEFSLKMKTITLTTNTSLKNLCHDLWISASPDRRRSFDVLANKVNYINKNYKKRLYRRQPNNNYVNDPNGFASFLINGIGFP